LARVGLDLPTEAQWERAARGGTTTRWWTGDGAEGVARAGNVRDKRFGAAAAAAGVELPWDPFDDGFVTTAPVGSLNANPFGLHDVVGNVWEWCVDVSAPYTRPARVGDGLRADADDAEVERAIRGGSYSVPADESRSASRLGVSGSTRAEIIGFRPARRL
jgi:formylglycine-generating enzyme